MREKITVKWLQKMKACEEAIIKFREQTETDSIKILQKLMRAWYYNWANWLIVRLMTYRQYVLYTIFATKQAINISEKKHLNNHKLRLSIW